MIHAYDRSYLFSAQKNLGCMLDYLVNELGNPIEKAWKQFLASDVSVRFEQGDCSVLAGKSGIELAYDVLEETGKQRPYAAVKLPCNKSREYWTGWAIAYYQWETGLPFLEIEAAIPVQEIGMLYEPYHEMDIRQLADRLNKRYREANPDTRLKRARAQAGLSQSELAEVSGVSVRTIQQYEQRQKNINRAQSETVLRLARALCCRMEDLLEIV